MKHTTHFDGCDCVMDKLKTLEAENEELKNYREDWLSERKWADYYYDKLQEAKSENAKLREALESIATLGNIFEEKASAQVAREALKGGE
jgi:hypothetical protein